MRLVDETFALTHFLFRYHIMPGAFDRVCRPVEGSAWRSWLLVRLIGMGVSSRARNAGVGRHPPHVIAEIARGDVRALSQLLGECVPGKKINGCEGRDGLASTNHIPLLATKTVG